MAEISLVITTLPTSHSLSEFCNTLLREGLAACVNVLPSIKSFYRWEGRLENAEESLILIKTASVYVDRLEIRIKELHPYKVFEFLVIDPSRVSQAYLNWVLSDSNLVRQEK